MTKVLFLGFFILLGIVEASAAQSPANSSALRLDTNARSTAGFVVLASAAGAALNSDLMKGGGTDDTVVLQALLDRARNGGRVHLILDGPALVSGLNVYGNSTLECTAGGGLYLKDGSSRAMIRNAHRSRDAILDEHITVRGCFLNGNRDQQPGAKPERAFGNNQEADGTFITGLQFLGVNYLTIENVTLWSIRSFGSFIGNASHIDIRNVIVDHGGPTDVDLQYANTDGLGFKGPLRYLTIDGFKCRTADDCLAFNANDDKTDDLTVTNPWGPYVRHGPITDVVVSNVVLMDAVKAIRVLSSRERIDRVVINNITGTLKGDYLMNISHFLIPESLGNIGSITISNVNVSRSPPDARIATELKAIVQKNKDNKIYYEEFNGSVFPLFSINAHVESLNLRNIMTTVSDDRPLLRFGPDAKVQQMSAELSVQDPQLQGVPVELDEGARIERLNLALDWKGNAGERGKNPIASFGGTIAQLHWVNTPPVLVNSELRDGNTVTITFSQEVKAADFKAGVNIQVNGKPVGISSALRQPDRADIIRYVLKTPVRPRDTLTWAYDAAEGAIQNGSGDPLPSIADERVTIE